MSTRNSYIIWPLESYSVIDNGHCLFKYLMVNVVDIARHLTLIRTVMVRIMVIMMKKWKGLAIGKKYTAIC